jgi:predicted RNA polymerase sigma factor
MVRHPYDGPPPEDVTVNTDDLLADQFEAHRAHRLLGGLTTAEIARAYLVPERTVAQRIVRAKKTIAAANVPFEVPSGTDRTRRLASVLEVIYLIFNEGYSAAVMTGCARSSAGMPCAWAASWPS